MKYHLQFNLNHGKARSKWVDFAVCESRADAEKELEIAVSKEADEYARARYKASFRVKGKRT